MTIRGLVVKEDLEFGDRPAQEWTTEGAVC